MVSISCLGVTGAKLVNDCEKVFLGNQGGSWKKFSTQRPGVGGSIFRENFFFPFLGNFFPDYEYWLILVYFSS